VKEVVDENGWCKNEVGWPRTMMCEDEAEADRKPDMSVITALFS
jgi:hypothetical protein